MIIDFSFFHFFSVFLVGSDGLMGSDKKTAIFNSVPNEVSPQKINTGT